MPIDDRSDFDPFLSLSQLCELTDCIGLATSEGRQAFREDMLLARIFFWDRRLTGTGRESPEQKERAERLSEVMHAALAIFSASRCTPP